MHAFLPNSPIVQRVGLDFQLPQIIPSKSKKKLRHGIVNASYNFCFNKKPWYIKLGDGKSQQIEAELHTTNKQETMDQRKKALPMSELIVT